MEREKTFENQLVERSSLWVFLVPFAQKFFFLNKSVVSFSLVVCVFFALLFDVFVKSRCKWREKSASNAEKQTQRAR